MKENHYKLFIATAVFVSAALLSACSGNAKRALGLNKQAPDEFTVVAKAPLVLPPDYNLVPPDKISATAADVRPQNKPKDILFNETNSAKKAKYDATTEKFLAMAGAEKDNSDIRKTINKETGLLIEENQDVDEMMSLLMGTVFPAIILPFFMLSLILVQMIGAEINEEKTTKGMEIIISNVSPKVHLFSKILSPSTVLD